MNLMKILLLLAIFGCTQISGTSEIISPDNEDMTEGETNSDFTKSDTLTYLALGDSYTIGESVMEARRWPIQLAQALRNSVPVKPPRIIAKTGWTTDELKSAINEAQIDHKFEAVSLLIGVNNQYRGYPIEQYRKEFEELLIMAISFCKAKEHVFVLSIPDYGVTPFGQSRDPAKIANEIDEYNSIAKSICEANEISFFDITPISRLASEQPDLIADDGLHPSGKMYAEWVKLVTPWALRNLGE
jgi:lysophospholipase L1-like esterase